MSEKNTLVVKINNQEYTLASSASREYMLGVADIVDKKMKEVSRLNPGLNTTHTAVLAALNVADEYVRLRREYDMLKKQSSRQHY
ncbi:MAG: cell division protein ZapA [Ruminococcaceae bacterium]|nr:cell division protein ZapA [Oscillospiraceae bacterium]